MGGEVLEEILRREVVRTAAGDELPLHSHISRGEGALLQQIVREVRPTVSLEIGLAYGVSAMFLCEALQEVGADVHIVVDPNQEEEWRGVGLHNLSVCPATRTWSGSSQRHRLGSCRGSSTRACRWTSRSWTGC